jgi:hypothetical protein
VQKILNKEKNVDAESENFFTEEKEKEVKKTLKEYSPYGLDYIPV